VLTGAVQGVSDDGSEVEASPDGRLIVFVDGALQEIRLAGSQGESARTFFRAPEGELVASVHWLADGKRIGYLRGKAGAREAVIETRDVNGGDPRTILEVRAENVAFAPDHRVFYTIKEPVPQQLVSLWTVTIDPVTGAAAAAPERITTWPGAVSAEPMTISGDGRRIALPKTFTQSDVYLVSLGDDGASTPPRRLTSDTLVDWPAAWVADASAFLFFSNRSGTFRAFRQPVTAETPEPVVAAAGNVRSPQLTADGKWILYIEMSWSPETARVMRMPAAGGPAEKILDVSSRLATASLQYWGAALGTSGWGARSFPDIRCPSRAESCFIAEARFKQAEHRADVVVSAIDPMTGSTRPVVTISDGNAAQTFWDVSPDGSMVAHGVWDWGGGDTITLTAASSGEQRKIAIKGFDNVLDIAWAPDARSLLAITATVRGGQLLRVQLDGAARLLQTFESQVLGNPRPSPDGRSILLGVAQSNSNAWIIER
jgi:Tol biopolymer transport system component